MSIEGMSQRVMESRLAEFVDRDNEMNQFREMLDMEDKQIMVVWGEGGIGKTSLLARMIHECSQRKLRKSEVFWSDSNPPNYMAVMRKIRDDIGADYFIPFTKLISWYTDPGYKSIEINLNLQGKVDVASKMDVRNSNIRNISGNVIKDNMFVIPRSDMDVPEPERRDKLTRRFLEDLKIAVANEPLIVFFDAVEKMSIDTERWIWGEFLNSIRNGNLPNVKFVLCGRNPPPDDIDWYIFLEEANLNPLEQKDIVNYLIKRKPELATHNIGLNMLADSIMDRTKGNALQVAKLVQILLKMEVRRERIDG